MPEQENPCCQRGASAAGGAIVGLVIIAVGTILLLDRMGIINGREALGYWPLALLAFGLFRLIAPRGSRTWGLLLTIAGALLSLGPLGLVQFRFQDLWPVLLIAVGVVMLWGSIQGRRAVGGLSTAFGHRPGVSTANLDELAVFGGGERTIVTSDFRGGRIRAVFGGWEIDLTQAAMQVGEAYIETKCVFGGVTLRVPESWDVTVRAAALLGGISDKTRHPRGEALSSAKRLTITGSAVFGGIEIKN